MSTGTPYTTDFSTPPPDPRASDPYFYGWRFVEHEQADGTTKREQIPLTEWDVLHPQEGDFIVLTDGHSIDCTYLQHSFEDIFEGQPQIKVFREHRVDWEVAKLIPHGPDITVVEGLKEEWDPKIGTFKMRSMGCKPLLVVEVTSPSTRTGDLDVKVKEYYLAGVPYYVIVDRQVTRNELDVELIGYERGKSGYKVMDQDAEKGLWVPSVGLWFKVEEERIACRTANGERIPDRAELRQELRSVQGLREQALQEAVKERQRADTATRRADTASRRADNERQRAEQERVRAEQEKLQAEKERQRAEQERMQAEKERQRANELEAKLREMEEKLSRLSEDG